MCIHIAQRINLAALGWTALILANKLQTEEFTEGGTFSDNISSRNRLSTYTDDIDGNDLDYTTPITQHVRLFSLASYNRNGNEEG